MLVLKLILAIALTLTLQAQAAVAIYSTGFGSLPYPGTPINPDLHWRLVASADPGVPTGTTFVWLGGFPIGPTAWLADNLDSHWISPTPNAYASLAGGTYTYQTTFDLTGVQDLTKVQLSGTIAADDNGTLSMNGVMIVSTDNPGYGQWKPFSITTGFLAGINTLTVNVTNYFGPSGVRVLVTGTTVANNPDPPPPPANTNVYSEVISPSMILAHTPVAGTLRIYVNGQRMTPTVDYTLSGTTVSFVFAIDTTTVLADYEY